VDRDRFVVSDAVWEKVAPLLPGKASDSGVTAKDNRLFLEAVLWRVRTGLPWRDLPEGFGKWNSVFQRFRRWVRAEVFDRVFRRVSDEPDFEYEPVNLSNLRDYDTRCCGPVSRVAPISCGRLVPSPID
jgi:transposase